MHPPRSPRGSPRWKGSAGGPHRSDPQDGHGVGGTPPPSRRTRLTEFRRGSMPGLPRVGIGEIGEEGSPRVLDEEARELGAGVVPGPHDVAYAGHGRSFRRPHDDARHRSQEPISFLDGEGQLAPRTTARQFARDGESGRPDHEERDEPADDQEIREPDLVELAVVPEPGDEDEGDQKQESGADQECLEAGVHRAHPIARATSNRPFSKRSASPRGAVVSAIDPTLETISSRYSRPRLRSRIGSASETAVAFRPSAAMCSRRPDAVCSRVTYRPGAPSSAL